MTQWSLHGIKVLGKRLRSTTSGHEETQCFVRDGPMIDGGPCDWTRTDCGNDLIYSVRSRGLRHSRVRPATWLHRAALPRLASSSCPCGTRQTGSTVEKEPLTRSLDGRCAMRLDPRHRCGHVEELLFVYVLLLATQQGRLIRQQASLVYEIREKIKRSGC